MSHTVLLVDYENVQQIESSQLPDDVAVRIFIGAKQVRKPGDRAVGAIVDRLVTDGVVSGSGKVLAYSFAKTTDRP